MSENDAGAPAPQISYDDFRKVDIRVGTIVAVDPQNPRTAITLARNAAHPAWQPISTLRDRR